MKEGQDLRIRTKAFALRIVRVVGALPRNAVARVIGQQLLRSGTSVGAQYREACCSRSDAELISKLNSALQELDERVDAAGHQRAVAEVDVGTLRMRVDADDLRAVDDDCRVRDDVAGAVDHPRGADDDRRRRGAGGDGETKNNIAQRSENEERTSSHRGSVVASRPQSTDA